MYLNLIFKSSEYEIVIKFLFDENPENCILLQHSITTMRIVIWKSCECASSDFMFKKHWIQQSIQIWIFPTQTNGYLWRLQLKYYSVYTSEFGLPKSRHFRFYLFLLLIANYCYIRAIHFHPSFVHLVREKNTYHKWYEKDNLIYLS